MANFNEAYNITLAYEGGYSNDGTDLGGETYKGISRKYNPSWSGWAIIDKLKLKPGFPSTAYKDIVLETSVKSFYKSKYWDVNSLDKFTNQAIAAEVFDTGVNMGTSKAAVFLQKTLNLLNKNKTLYKDLLEDGNIGPVTLDILKICLAYRGPDYIFKILNILQGYQYVSLMGSNPVQEKFAYGWLDRVTFIKT